MKNFLRKNNASTSNKNGAMLGDTWRGTTFGLMITTSLHLEMDGWNMRAVSFWDAQFFRGFWPLVSGSVSPSEIFRCPRGWLCSAKQCFVD